MVGYERAIYTLIMFLRNTNWNDDVPTGSQSFKTFLEERYTAVSQYWQSAEVCFLKLLLGHTHLFVFDHQKWRPSQRVNGEMFAVYSLLHYRLFLLFKLIKRGFYNVTNINKIFLKESQFSQKYEAVKLFSTLIIIWNVQHMIMISEGSCGTEDFVKIQLWSQEYIWFENISK